MTSVAKQIADKLDQVQLGDDIEDMVKLAEGNNIVIIFLDKEDTMVLRGAVNENIRDSVVSLSPKGLLGPLFDKVKDSEGGEQIGTIQDWLSAYGRSFTVLKEYAGRRTKLVADVPSHSFVILDKREYYGDGLVVDLSEKDFKNPSALAEMMA